MLQSTTKTIRTMSTSIGLLFFALNFCILQSHQLIWEDNTNSNFNWEQANQHCVEKYAGNGLASILNDDEWEVFTQYPAESWIGLQKFDGGSYHNRGKIDLASSGWFWNNNESELDPNAADTGMWLTNPTESESCALTSGERGAHAADCSSNTAAKGYLCAGGPRPINLAYHSKKECEETYDSTWTDQYWGVYDRYVCKIPTASITITACNGYNYINTRANLLELKLKGTGGVTQYEFVNKFHYLPLNGDMHTFYINSPTIAAIGDLLSLDLRVNDEDGYCMKDLSIQIYDTNYYYHFSSANYFGHGIMLSSKCDYSYQFLSHDIPLISCLDDVLQLKTYSTRARYQVNIHTCHSSILKDNIDNGTGISIGISGAGISAQKMKGLYLSVMGKTANNKKNYKQTKLSYLDHVYSRGEVDINSLGHLLIANTRIQGLDWYFTHDTTLVKFIGIKIESVNYKSNPIISGHGYDHEISLTMRQQDYNFQLNPDLLDIQNRGMATYDITLRKPFRTFDNGRYLIAMINRWEATWDDFVSGKRIRLDGVDFNKFTNEGSVDIFSGAQIRITTHFLPSDRDYNVYLILGTPNGRGYHPSYKLPWVIMDNVESRFNWFQANQFCKTEFGTTLASLHSEDELWLISNFHKELQKWIGLTKHNTQSPGNWVWNDNSHVGNSLGTTTGNDCGYTNQIGQLQDGQCHNNKNGNQYKSYVCASPQWLPNTERTFEINMDDEYIQDITLVSIGNNNQDALDDLICIDAVTIDDKEARYLSSNWIGIDTENGINSPQSYAIYKYPVCGTEITDIRLANTDSLTNLHSNEITQDSVITGYKCSNNNRLFETECSISQTVETQKTTELTISAGTHKSKTHEFSRGISRENSWNMAIGSHLDVTIGTEVEAGAIFAKAKVSSEVNMGISMEYNWGESSRVTTNDQHGSTEGTTTDHKDSWISTSKSTVECSASIKVPPAHFIEYSLILNGVNTTLETRTDLKLTLCSAFTGDVNDESNYIVIKDIAAEIHDTNINACNVQFEPAKYIQNNGDVSCENLQQLSIALGSTYTPTCNATDTEKYDVCQCDTGNLRTLSKCWCVDAHGNPQPGKVKNVPENVTEKTVCEVDLNCADIAAKDQSPSMPGNGDQHNN